MKVKFRERKNIFLAVFFRWYFKKSLQKHFYSVNIRGLELINIVLEKSKRENIPVVICANHSNWWDAILVSYFTLDYFKIQGYCLMETKQLEKNSFFNALGAIPIVREDSKTALGSLQFCKELLEGKSRTLWIFPQGEIVPFLKTPLNFYTGAAYLLSQLQQCYCVDVIFDYRFKKEQRPDIFVDFFDYKLYKKNDITDRKLFASEQEKKFEQKIKSFENEFNNTGFDENLEGFHTILKGKNSKDKR